MEKEYIRKLKTEIEEKLSWNPSRNWKQRDYEYLCEMIFKKTKILLSVSTLKRIWSSDIKTVPHLTTLNALAKFVGYEDWYGYKRIIDNHVNGKNNNISTPKERLFVFSNSILKIIIAFTILVILTIAVSNLLKNPNYDKVIFSSKNVVNSEIPNTVIFNYDVSMVEADSFFIQQSWDMRMRDRIDPANHQYTSIYYYPGAHRAKLIINEDVIREKFVHINTKGWLALARYELNQLIPTYLEGIEIVKDNRLFITEQELLDNNILVNEKDYFIDIYNVRDFDNLSGDEFCLETEVKCPLAEGADACGEVIIFMLCEFGRQAVNIGTPGCAANFNLKIIDKWINGRENDLSIFGCDMEKWNKITYKTKNKKVTISLNNIIVYEVDYTKSAGKLVGLHYVFHKTGSVNYVRLRNGNNKIVYEDNFEN